VNVRQLLDLAGLFENPARLVAGLRSTSAGTVDQVIELASPPSDATTRRTVQILLQSLGAGDEIGALVRSGASAVADSLEIALDLKSELTARQQPPYSHLVVTATTAPELGAMRRTLNLPPLFQLVEDVIRASEQRCVLGAPYWNAAALDRLRPSLYGFARRRGEIHFVCQGGDPDGPFNAAGLLRRCCMDLMAEGSPSAEVWAFEVRGDNGGRALIHAKFALADGRLGYLGSANMTGQGFAEHFEIGVRLGPAEAMDLAVLLDRLKTGHFLVQVV
jgi:phosphatidylserine/phosphatidylglycerophosphate/cardiolipin synthase-like enzyme